TRGEDRVTVAFVRQRGPPVDVAQAGCIRRLTGTNRPLRHGNTLVIVDPSRRLHVSATADGCRSARSGSSGSVTASISGGPNARDDVTSGTGDEELSRLSPRAKCVTGGAARDRDARR